MAEIQDCRLLRNSRYRQIDTGKAAQGLAVIERILHRPVGQPIPLLQEVDPQHPLQTNRRSAALALRIERSQTLHQPRPRHDLLHLGQKLVAPRLLLLAGVFRLRKASLKLHRPVPQSPHRRILPYPDHSRAISSVFPKRSLQEIWMAETSKEAEAAFDAFIAAYEVKYDKAAECLAKDRQALPAFSQFPPY